jgi:hypothetical protein
MKRAVMIICVICFCGALSAQMRIVPPLCDIGLTGVVQQESTYAGAMVNIEAGFVNLGTMTIPANVLSFGAIHNGSTLYIANSIFAIPSAASGIIQFVSIQALPGINTICIYSILSCDSVNSNDTICTSFYAAPYTAVPYFEDFESSPVWYSHDTLNWQWGIPAGSTINSAFSGQNAWVTNLTGNYPDSAHLSLYTPVFDLSTPSYLDTVKLRFRHWIDIMAGDFCQVQYRMGASSWTTLGSVLDANGVNWYNNQVQNNDCFGASTAGWVLSQYTLPVALFNGHDSVQFRFLFSSDTAGNANGWAIDDFSLIVVPAVDVGVVMINEPVLDTLAFSNIHVTVTIQNFGTLTPTSVPLMLTLNGDTISIELWSGVLPPMTTEPFTFAVPFTVPVTSPYNLCVSTELTNDYFSANNQTCKSFSVAPFQSDIGISAMVAPNSWWVNPDGSFPICFYEQFTNPGCVYSVVFTVKNRGKDTVYTFPIEYSFRNFDSIHHQVWVGTLLPADSVLIVLNDKFKPLLGNQEVKIAILLPDDQNPSDNMLAQVFQGLTCQCPVGVPDDSNGFSLHQCAPNPASRLVTITYNSAQCSDISFGLVNMEGQVLHVERGSSNPGVNMIELDVSRFPSGVYSFFIEHLGRRFTQKLVISH